MTDNEVIDELREQLRQEQRHSADMAKQLRAVREWMAQHAHGVAREAARDLSRRLLWSDAAEQPEPITAEALGTMAADLKRTAGAPVETDRRVVEDRQRQWMQDKQEPSRASLSERVANLEQRLRDHVDAVPRPALLSKRTWAKINRHIDETTGRRKQQDVEHIDMIADRQSILIGRVTAINGAVQELAAIVTRWGDVLDRMPATLLDLPDKVEALEQELVKLGDKVQRNGCDA